MAKAKILFIYTFIFSPIIVSSQICEPFYTVPNLIQTNSNAGEMTDGSSYTAHITIGQAITINQVDNVVDNSAALGFWSTFLKEPVAPVLRASDGDYQDMIKIEWDIQDDLTGPPVTTDEVTLVRNDFILATLPISQTYYNDFNVFPGADYQYEAIVSNNLGSSRGGADGGFLNPNGVITGQVLTQSFNAVKNTKVTLSPNLGKSIQFEGDGYIFWFDKDINTNRQFTGLENNYTLETWFRSVEELEQTMFSAVDSASENYYVNLGLTDEGKVSWTHKGVTLISVDKFAGPGQPWHHLAVVYNGGAMTMYVNGSIAGELVGEASINDKVEIVLGKNGPIDHTKFFKGYLDDFRIWDRAVDWETIRSKNDLTLRGSEENLVAYWKLDEVEGNNIFDLTDNKFHGTICNINRSELFAPVFVGDLTDSLGNYAINGIYYGQGTTFMVSPSQETIVGRSLEFDGVNDHVNFQNQRINLMEGFTIEGWFKTASNSEMVLFFAEDPAIAESSDDAHVRFKLEQGIPKFYYFDQALSGQNELNNNSWHHWAITLDAEGDGTLNLYIDGESASEASILSSSEFSLMSRPGFASDGYSSKFFEGDLDEFRVWSSPRNIDQISGTMNTPLNGDENGLINYWNFNDGTGNLLNDNAGSLVTGTISGMVEGEEAWTIDIPLTETFEHYYDPESRQSTLNYSNTSVDLVNFTDKSLIPVSGYVRYENTSCFIENAEILVNGESKIPPVYTDTDGKYIVDIEPGSAGKLLSVSFKDHEFSPPVIELPLITTPITGLYFDDTKTYDVSGIVAGGSCKFPITPDQGHIEVTFSSVSGCIEKTVIPDTLTGAYVLSDLPPIIYNASVNHPNPSISFTADTLSLENEDRTREFIYQAPLETAFIGLPETEVVCETYPLVLNQRKDYYADFEVYETYVNKIGSNSDSHVVNQCLVENFTIEVFDNISDTTYQFEAEVPEEEEYPPHIKFTGRAVNLLSGGDFPYQKNIQIVVEDSLSRSATATMWALIQGDKKIPGVNFSTTTSKKPWFVLRVPPGDGSSTFITSEQTLCNTTVRTINTELDASTTNTIHAGIDIEIQAGVSLGAHLAKTDKFDFLLDIGAGFSTSISHTSTNEINRCLQTSETFRTSADGLITGDDATVFIGGGTTVDIGIARNLRLEQCGVVIDTVMTSDLTGVNSTYIHSKYYIENYLMPDLLNLWTLNDDADALENYYYWQTILDMNSAAIATAVSSDLLQIGEDGEEASSVSFDALADIEYSYARENSSSYEITESFTNIAEISASLGVQWNGIGGTSENVTSTTSTNEDTKSNSDSKTQTIGFTLSDNDPGDGFSFTAKRDLYWDMPVFDIIGGQSSCPYEEGTFASQLTSMSVTENSINDVSPEESANFTVLLGNESETGEAQPYTLTFLAETNPDGASISAGGVNLAGGLIYNLEPETQIEVTVSISRGPIEYDYEDITLMLVPPCEYQIAQDLGNRDNPQNSSFVKLTAKFQKPCSYSNIFSPEAGWVITSSHDDGDSLLVTLNDFDVENEALESLDLQYRVAGQGDWFNAVSINRETLLALTDDFIIVPWNIEPTIIPDGEYDLRSVAKCGGDTPDGISQTITGLIDRSGPLVFGLPEPVDGILGADDLIRISFNEPVDCESINVGAGDLKLFNTVTGNPVAFTYTCGNNMISLEPAVSNHYIENQTFRAEINVLSDLLDNTISETVMWEFFINRNPIEWVGTNISNIVLFVEDEFATNRQLINNGGSNRSWYMHGGRDISSNAAEYPGNTLNIPTWLEYSLGGATLTPGSSQDVSISLAEGLNFGEYKTVLYAGVNGLGDEPMIIDIRKICHEPEWVIDPFEYQYSMNMVAMLRTNLSEAVLDTSSDIYDLVGVFVGEELRGLGRVEYMPEFESMSNFHPYKVFLTIYSNVASGEELSFNVWDASDCNMLGQVNENFSFSANSIEGGITSPAILTATSEIVSAEVLEAGWNWFSLNTDQSDMSTNNILSVLSPSANDIIKSQNEYAQYSEISDMWVGDLDSISHRSTYLIKIADKDTLLSTGFPIDVELDTIDINDGWTWIGYTPQQSYSVNDALLSIDDGSLITGNIVKSQTGFAQYVENFGWFGSLDYMDPGNGYLLYATGNDGLRKLLYPFVVPGALSIEQPDTEQPETRSIADNEPAWNVNPYQFSSSMNITGQLKTFDQLSINENDIVGAFLNGECRGVGHQQYIEALDAFVVFLMVYGDDQDFGDIEFRVYAAETDEILYVPNTIPFVVNDIIGNFDEFYSWDARMLSAGDAGFLPQVFSLAQNYPNPFNPITTIGYGIPEQSNVQILVYNILGEVVKTIVNQRMEAGYYFSSWNATNDFGAPVSAGIYFYEIHANDFVKTRKLLLLK